MMRAASKAAIAGIPDALSTRQLAHSIPKRYSNPGDRQEQAADLLAFPEEGLAHWPGLEHPLHAPQMRDVLLGGEVGVNVPILIMQVAQQVHEKAVDHKGLVEFANGVAVDAG